MKRVDLMLRQVVWTHRHGILEYFVQKLILENLFLTGVKGWERGFLSSTAKADICRVRLGLQHSENVTSAGVIVPGSGLVWILGFAAAQFMGTMASAMQEVKQEHAERVTLGKLIRLCLGLKQFTK